MSHVEFPGLGWSFDINSTAFSIGSFEIKWYGLLIATGFLLAVIYAMVMCKKMNINRSRLLDTIIVGLIAGVIGARLYYVIFYPGDKFIKDPISIFYIHEGGLGIYGGIIGALLVGGLFAKFRKQNVLAVLDIALVRRIAVKYSVHDTVALGVGHELTTVADQTAGRNHEFQAGRAAVAGGHVDQFALSLTELFDNVSGKLFRNIDIYLLHRLELVTLFIIMVQNLSLADCKLIALTAHVLDQDGQMQLAASGYLKAIGGICFFHAKGNVSI